MATDNGQRFDRSRRTVLKGALLSGSLAGCLGGGDEETPGSNAGGFSPTPTESPTPTPTATPIPMSDEAHPLPNDADVFDRIVFGSEPSETAHDLAPETSELVRDPTDTLGRRILQPDAPDDGTMSACSLSFTMACAPEERTYVTIKVPARPASSNYLSLVDENDDVVGTTHASGAWPSLTARMFGVYDSPTSCETWLDITNHSEYVYLTARLPRYLTEGSDSFTVRIAQLMNKSAPSMPILRAYTHTDAVFDLPADEADGHNFDIGTPAGASSDPMANHIETIDTMVGNIQTNDGLPPRELLGLAMAYSRDDWIESVDRERILEVVVNTIDHWARRQAETSPGELLSNRRGWEEHGHIARAMNLVADQLAERDLLSADVEDHPEAPIQRREAYAQFFDEGIDWRSRDRKRVYNQTAIVTIGLLRANRALETLGSDRARDQAQIDRWIDQAIGIAPMAGRGGAYTGSGTYYHATEAGITKEGAEYDIVYGPLGVHLTAVLAHETGLDRVAERASEMVEAYGYLRWFVKGCDGANRSIAPDGVISNRNHNHMGSAKKWRGYGFSPLFNAMVLEDDVSKRWAELAIEHDTVRYDFWRKNPGSLRRRIPQVEAYRAVSEMDDSGYTIPLNRETDLWFDVDMGLVAIQDGETGLVANIPHSASTNKNDHGVTRRCAAHYRDPEQGDRIVQAQIRRLEYPAEGDTWTRPDNLVWAADFIDGAGQYKDRDRYLPWRDETKTMHNAMAGEEVPQTSQIRGDSWPGANGASGSPDPRVGMGIHYREVTIGPYLIGINSTGNEQRGFGPGRDFEMSVPTAEATNLETGETVTGDTVTVPPRSGVVLKLED